MTSLNLPDTGRPVYFLSDAHIGAGSGREEAGKEQLLLAFLSRVEQRAAALVILGDLFDFWFEYRHAIPARGFRILTRLRSLVDSGIPVTFIGGNHDFWAGPFLRNQIGLLTSDGPVETECQGRRLFMAHGDGLGPGDRGYHFIRAVFRNRLAIAAYRLIHPDLGIPLATSSSRPIRRHTEDIPVVVRRLWKYIACPQFERGSDAVLIGHFHHAVHWRDEAHDFIVNGDWIDEWTYSVLDDGVFTLFRWPEERLPVTGPGPR